MHSQCNPIIKIQRILYTRRIVYLSWFQWMLCIYGLFVLAMKAQSIFHLKIETLCYIALNWMIEQEQVFNAWEREEKRKNIWFETVKCGVVFINTTIPHQLFQKVQGGLEFFSMQFDSIFRKTHINEISAYKRNFSFQIIFHRKIDFFEKRSFFDQTNQNYSL